MKLILSAVILLAPLAALARAEQQLVHMEVIQRPSIVSTAKGARLAYELHVTNFASTTLRLLKLSVFDEEDRLLKELEAADMSAATLVVSGDADSVLGPGQRAVVYLDIYTPPGGVRGGSLFHALTLTAIESENAPATVTGARTEIGREPPPIVGAPLRGGPWIAVYDPGVERGHRRVFYATEGRATLPGRFAVDFIKPDAEGRFSPDDGETPSTYYGFGEPVLAVANGTVVDVRDDVADPLSRSGRDRPSIGNASGNYVIIDIGRGFYAFYEHLKQGVPIKAGDSVRKGDVIGALGFTGSASVPHLHFHVADQASVLGAEGRAFVFTRFERIGEYPSMEALGDGPWSQPDNRGIVEDVMPGHNVVLTFGERRNRDP